MSINWATLPSMTCIFMFTLVLASSCEYFSGTKKDHPELTGIMIRQSKELIRHSPVKAIASLDSSFQRIKNPGIGDLYACLKFKRMVYTDTLNKPDAGLIYADSILVILKPIAESPPYRLKYAEELLAKGDILFKLHFFNEAYAAYFDARSVMENADNKCDKSSFFSHFYRRLADISYGKRSFVEAALWQKKALSNLNACGHIPGDDYLTQGTLDNIALSYMLAGKLDSALVYFDKALKFIAKMKIAGVHPVHELEEAEGVILGNRGTLFFRQRKMKDAEADFIRSISINEKRGYANEDAYITRIKLGELYLRSGQINAAEAQINKISDDTLRSSPLLVQQQFVMFKANYTAAKGQVTQSNALLKRYINISDSLKIINRSLFTTDFSTEFELLKKQYDLGELNRKNQWQTVYLMASVAGGLFAIVIIYLLIKNSRQIKRSAKLSAAHNSQLEAALSSLEKSSRENAKLTSIVAHDLKNPISAIYSISSFMLNDEHTEENTELLQLIKKSSEHLNEIVSEILHSRYNSEGAKSLIAPENLGNLLKESVDLLQYRAIEKKQKIVLNRGENIMVSVNKEIVWRVVNNLIVNAVKFSPIQTVIKLSWEVTGEMVTVSVIDQGVGIPYEYRDQIFQMATEGKRAGTSGEESFGLGLYISRRLIEEQRGKLWLSHSSDKGSIFCFSLPIIKMAN